MPPQSQNIPMSRSFELGSLCSNYIRTDKYRTTVKRTLVRPEPLWPVRSYTTSHEYVLTRPRLHVHVMMSNNSVGMYRELPGTSRVKSLPELRLRREIQGWLIGHFAAYHERFGHEEADLECPCGQKRTQLHPFRCAHARKHKPHLWCTKLQRQLAPEEVLGSDGFCKVGAHDSAVSPALWNTWHDRRRRGGRRIGVRQGTLLYNNSLQ